MIHGKRVWLGRGTSFSNTKGWREKLAERTKGLGATWTTLHLGNADRVAEALGIPGDFTQAVMLPVGYYTGDSFKPATRKPVSSYIHHNGW